MRAEEATHLADNGCRQRRDRLSKILRMDGGLPCGDNVGIHQHWYRDNVARIDALMLLRVLCRHADKELGLMKDAKLDTRPGDASST